MTDKFDVIQYLFDSYIGEYTDGNLKAYVANLAAFSDQTVAKAVGNFTNSKINRNGSYRPSSEELFKECDRIVNGAASDPNSPLERFRVARDLNNQRIKREDADSLEDRQKRLEVMSDPKRGEIKRLVSDKKLSPEQRLVALEKIKGTKPGSKFVHRFNEEEKQAAQKRLDSLEQIQTRQQIQRIRK
ncbi:MAG: hypothetical protein GY941_29855 [Planctomycetes bacterium]|nr:hypothetical protein [Planctomycetota bacterium]